VRSGRTRSHPPIIPTSRAASGPRCPRRKDGAQHVVDCCLPRRRPWIRPTPATVFPVKEQEEGPGSRTIAVRRPDQCPERHHRPEQQRGGKAGRPETQAPGRPGRCT
jgi:hypothetical protein